MHAARLLLLVTGLAACRASPSEQPALPEPRTTLTAPEDARTDAPWPDVRSDDGNWTLRLRPFPESLVLTEDGPALEIEARLLTDDLDVLFAGRPQARVLSPTAAQAVEPELLHEEAWSGLRFPERRTASLYLPRDRSDAGPVDVEVHCRLMRVETWTTHEFDALGPGEHDEVEAAPYFLSIGCHPEVVTVTATLPRESRTHVVPPGAVRRLLPHAWAARAAQVRDARGTLLESTGMAGNQRASTVGFEACTREQRVPIVYPVTVRLAVPASWELQYPRFELRGLTLPVEPRAASPEAAVRVLDLP